MISVIIPVYNSENYVERCIESILFQTYNDWELIVVNDGSTDDSERIIKNLAASDSRIRYYNKNNGGVSSARNLGIKYAKGEFLLFLDSDDWLSPDTCEVLIKNVVEKKADCIIYGFHQTHGHIWAPEKDIDYASLSELKSDFDYWLNTELLSSSVNKLYRKSLLSFLFNEDVSFGEDLIFSLEYISNCNKISFITSPLYQHEVNNNSSITHSFNQRRLNEIECLQSKVLEFAEMITIETYRKYYNDVIRYVKMLFRQRHITSVEKCEIARNWFGESCYKKLQLWPLRANFIEYIYARLIQLEQWKLLCFFHEIKHLLNMIK